MEGRPEQAARPTPRTLTLASHAPAARRPRRSHLSPPCNPRTPGVAGAPPPTPTRVYARPLGCPFPPSPPAAPPCLGVPLADGLDDRRPAGGVDGQVVRDRQPRPGGGEDLARLLRRDVAGLRGAVGRPPGFPCVCVCVCTCVYVCAVCVHACVCVYACGSFRQGLGLSPRPETSSQRIPPRPPRRPSHNQGAPRAGAR
jgi:hypothetical protein